MGLMWGLFSVIIASVAQLSLGFAASHLPPMTHLWDFIAALLAFGLDARILLLGLLGYLLSVFCYGAKLGGLSCCQWSFCSDYLFLSFCQLIFQKMIDNIRC